MPVLDMPTPPPSPLAPTSQSSPPATQTPGINANRAPLQVTPAKAKAKPGSSRIRACDACHSSKVSCGGWNEDQECGTCRRKGLSCGGPSTAAPIVDPNKAKRKPKGTVMLQLKSSLAGMGSALSQLNSVQLSASLQRSLVLTAQELDEQAFVVAGATFSGDKYDFTKKGTESSFEDVQIVALAALGSRSSDHTAIIGSPSGTSSPPVGRRRLTPFKALADRAYKVSEKVGLLSITLKPTIESYETLVLLRYALTGMVSRHEGYDQVNKTVLRQRNALLADPALDHASKARVTCRESVSLLLCDCIQAVQVGAEYCSFTDEDLRRDFGWSLDGLSADLSFIKRAAAAGLCRADGPGAATVSANEAFDAVGRLSVWVVRTLVDLRRQGWTGEVPFASVAATINSVTETLFELGVAFDRFRDALELLRAPPDRPDDFAVWEFCLGFVERKLIGYNMLVWDVAVLWGHQDGARPAASAEHVALVDEVELRAAQAMRFLLTPTATHSVLIYDYFHKLSFYGGFFSALFPGTAGVELAVRAVAEGREHVAGRLAGVGMQLSHLETFLASLRQTSELMGPAADQAEALERGIAGLREEEAKEAARVMVAGALAELEGK